MKTQSNFTSPSVFGSISWTLESVSERHLARWRSDTDSRVHEMEPNTLGDVKLLCVFMEDFDSSSFETLSYTSCQGTHHINPHPRLVENVSFQRHETKCGG